MEISSSRFILINSLTRCQKRHPRKKLMIHEICLLFHFAATAAEYKLLTPLYKQRTNIFFFLIWLLTKKSCTKEIQHQLIRMCCVPGSVCLTGAVYMYCMSIESESFFAPIINKTFKLLDSLKIPSVTWFFHFFSRIDGNE